MCLAVVRLPNEQMNDVRVGERVGGGEVFKCHPPSEKHYFPSFDKVCSVSVGITLCTASKRRWPFSHPTYSSMSSIQPPSSFVRKPSAAETENSRNALMNDWCLKNIRNWPSSVSNLSVALGHASNTTPILNHSFHRHRLIAS